MFSARMKKKRHLWPQQCPHAQVKGFLSCTCLQEQFGKGKDYIALPAYKGSLAEAKKMPVIKPFRSRDQEQNIKLTAYQARWARTNLNPRTSA
eukprot:9246-Pelagomonas_calceolata.AAC.1